MNNEEKEQKDFTAEEGSIKIAKNEDEKSLKVKEGNGSPSVWISTPEIIKVENKEKGVSLISNKTKIQLIGLKSIEKPINLDKLLLSNQSNNILSRIKRKKKKKVKKDVETPDTDETKVSEMNHKENIEKLFSQKSNEEVKDMQNSTLSNLKLKPKLNQTVKENLNSGNLKPIKKVKFASVDHEKLLK